MLKNKQFYFNNVFINLNLFKGFEYSTGTQL